MLVFCHEARGILKEKMDELLLNASVFKRELHTNAVVLKKLWEEVAVKVEKDGKY